MSTYDDLISKSDALASAAPRALKMLLRQGSVYLRIARLAVPGTERDFRCRAIAALRGSGFTLSEIGEAFDISGSRVHQISNQENSMDSLLEYPIYKKVFALGADAASQGLGKEENPYDAGTRKYAIWLLGYQSKS